MYQEALFDFGIIAAEIILMLLVLGILQFLLNLTLQKFSQWLDPDADFNPFKAAQGIFDRFFLIVRVIGLIAIVGINGYCLYQGQSIHLYVLDLIQQVPLEQWKALGIGALRSVLLLLLTTVLIIYLRPWFKRKRDHLKAWKSIAANNRSIDKLFSAIDLSVCNGIWIMSLALCLDFLFVPWEFTRYFYKAIGFYFIICLGIIFLKTCFVLIDTFDALSDSLAEKYTVLRFYPRFRYLINFTKRCLEYAVYAAIAGIILNQISFFQTFAGYSVIVNQVILIIFAAGFCIEIGNILTEKILLRSPNLTPFQRRRRITFIPLVQTTLRYLIFFAAGVATLYAIGIDPTPILAGAGIVGIAVGLGAQNLINDLVNGFSILLQNYYLVGDFVETDNATGIVEEMDLRVTRIRSPGGRLHILRNGDIKTIINYSKEYVYAVVYVGVDYESNLDHVYRVIEEAGQQIKELHPDVLEPTRIDGLDDFGESELTIRTATKVKPGKHLPVARLLRKLIKEAFDRENIEIPFARRVLILKNSEEEGNSEAIDLVKNRTIDAS